MQIEPDMIVRNVVNRRLYRVRSVTLTEAIVWPCNRVGGKLPGRGATAIKYRQSDLRIVRVSPKS
jgi:hypothetical protein